MKYSKYSNQELLDIHENMMDYSGKADADLQKEIDARGGLEHIDELVNSPNEEAKIIRKEIFRLYGRDPNPVTIKKALNSNRLIPDTENHPIDIYIADIGAYLENRKVDRPTWNRVGFGFVLSLIICTTGWYFSMIYLGEVYYRIIPLLGTVSIGIIWLISGKDRGNTLVLIGGFLSAFLASIIGLLMYRGL